VRKKKVPKKIWAEERKKKRVNFTTLASSGTGRDEKGTPIISAPSIHIGAQVGTGSLWPP
jgi:hypothetical protein